MLSVWPNAQKCENILLNSFLFGPRMFQYVLVYRIFYNNQIDPTGVWTVTTATSSKLQTWGNFRNLSLSLKINVVFLPLLREKITLMIFSWCLIDKLFQLLSGMDKRRLKEISTQSHFNLAFHWIKFQYIYYYIYGWKSNHMPSGNR